MICQLILRGQDEHQVEVKVTGKYVDNGIGLYEFWGHEERDIRIEFECDVEKVMLISRSGKSRREIFPNEKQLEQIEKQIKHEFDLSEF